MAAVVDIYISCVTSTMIDHALWKLYRVYGRETAFDDKGVEKLDNFRNGKSKNYQKYIVSMKKQIQGLCDDKENRFRK